MPQTNTICRNIPISLLQLEVGFDRPDRTHDTRVRTVWALLASMSATKTEEMPESSLPFGMLGRKQIPSNPRAILRLADECTARCSIILNR